MKILIISQYFYPENFRINDFATKMVKRGHDVTVLTGLPNYPNGKFFGEYTVFKEEIINGAKVIRMPLFPRGNGGKIALLLNYISFLMSCIFFGLFQIRRVKADLIFAVNYTPPTASLIGLLASKIYKKPLYIWVQDLWPESLSATGTIKSKYLLGLVKQTMTFIYRQATGILIQSRSFRSKINAAVNDENKIHYFPNWAEDLYEKRDLSNKNQFAKFIPKDKFIVMFAGNLGVAQSLETIIDAAERVRSHPIHWAIVGDGRQSEWLDKIILEKKLENNISALGRFPIEDMTDFFDLADVMLVTLKKDQSLNLTIPGKIQSYLKYGKPIISALDGEGASVIKNSNAGINVPAEDGANLALSVIKMSQMPEQDLHQMSRCAKEYYMKNFDSDYLLSKFENLVDLKKSNNKKL